MKTYRFFVLLLCSVCFAPALFGQYGYSSGSLSMGKMRAAARAIPTPDEIVLEEYFNYHRHAINIPEGNSQVALDIQWGGAELTGRADEAILQVGIATQFAQSLADLPPVNVTLVIDKSGSMRGDRIAKAREAAHAFVDRLRPEDILSIVAFDDGVEVLLPAMALGQVGRAHRAIDRIQDAGGTNLDLGMLTGYEQLIRHQKRGQTNRLIMLTDALTNQGITDPTEMVKHSQYYVDDFEVDFTIVGVGTDFNQTLSRKLTASARSSIFFINDSEDLKKVFIDEVESLLSPVGRDVMLEIALPIGMEAVEIYGYKGSTNGSSVGIPLENMNGGLTMVALIRVKIGEEAKWKNRNVQARLRYFDVQKQQNCIELATEKIKGFPQTSQSVEKNFTIAEMAQGLQLMANFYQISQPQTAQKMLDLALLKVEMRYPDQEDEDIRRVYDILKKYQQDMREIAQNDRE